MQPSQIFEFFPHKRAGEACRYTFTSLTLADIETINLAIRAKIIRAARLSLDGCENSYARGEVLDSANRIAGEISLLSGQHASYFGTVEGQSQILFTVISKLNSKFTLEDAYGITCDARNNEEIEYAFLFMKGFTADEIRSQKEQAKSKGEAKTETENPPPQA